MDNNISNDMYYDTGSTYCISDIHGCYDEFLELLNKIQYDPCNDKLYILGDVIDYGPQSLECLNYIMGEDSGIRLILGEHEKMMLDYYNEPTKRKKIEWQRNGGEPTMVQLNRLSENKLQEIIEFLTNDWRCTSYVQPFPVNDKEYVLSHYQGTAERYIYAEYLYHLDTGWTLPKYAIIMGHKPTQHIRGNRDYSILHETSAEADLIYIDSGCVFGGALAAYRLEDSKEFYVKSKKGVLKND